MMNLGKAIRLCRTQRDLSLEALANTSGLSMSYLSLLERGKRDPSFSITGKIARALDIPLSILVFLAATDDELDPLPKELCEKLSYVALRLMAVNDE